MGALFGAPNERKPPTVSGPRAALCPVCQPAMVHSPIRINMADPRSAAVLAFPGAPEAYSAPEENRPQCGAVGGSVLPEGFSEKVGARENLLAERTRPARRATRPSRMRKEPPTVSGPWTAPFGLPRAEPPRNRSPSAVEAGTRAMPSHAPQHGKPSPGLAKGHRSRVAAGKGGSPQQARERQRPAGHALCPRRGRRSENLP